MDRRAFEDGIYRAHLEASFLYQMRNEQFHNAEMMWTELREIEERLEAHLEGPAIGLPPGNGISPER